jgi:hypothetical protein
MNDRMTELHAKACLYARDKHLEDKDVPAFIQCMSEKFAELIVRECIEICNQHPSKTFKKEWDADVVAWDITQRIKGRFGVEE